MNLVKGLLTTVGLTVAAAGAALAARTETGKRFTERARQRLDEMIASVRSRLSDAQTSTEPTPAPETELDAKVETEHAREHGVEGRTWASAHARKPHVANDVMANGVRNVVMRRVHRHV